MIKTYVKTAAIKAEQFDGSEEMIEKYKLIRPIPRDPNYMLNMSDGLMSFGVGDWLATGVNDEHWVVKNDVFKKTYAELPVIPEMVSKYIEVVQGEVALYDAMDTVLAGFGTLPNWMSNNQDLFARAWLDGYQVEEDK